MNHEQHKSFEINPQTAERWNEFPKSEKKRIFEKVYSKEIANRPEVHGTEIIDIMGDKYAEASLDVCYFPNYPDFQKALCEEIESQTIVPK